MFSSMVLAHLVSIKKVKVKRAQIYQSVPLWLGMLVRRLLFLVFGIGDWNWCEWRDGGPYKETSDLATRLLP